MSETTNKTISLWDTKTLKDIEMVIGFRSPYTRGFLANSHRAPQIDLGDYTPLISFEELRETRQFRELYESVRLPDIQYLDLTTDKDCIAERVDFGDCKTQRATLCYSSKKYANEQGYKPRLRLITKKEKQPYSVTDLRIKDGRKLYVTLRCALCGYQKRIVITPKNQGRKNPVCANKHKPQQFWVKFVKPQKKKVDH